MKLIFALAIAFVGCQSDRTPDQAIMQEAVLQSRNQTGDSSLRVRKDSLWREIYRAHDRAKTRIANFAAFVLREQADSAAQFVYFPLYANYAPAKSKLITSKKELKESWKQIFTPLLVQAISKADLKDPWYHNNTYCLGNGELWFDDMGQLISVNLGSDSPWNPETISEATASRSAVSEKEVTGTFRMYHPGGRLHNEARILALGKNKLWVEFDFIWPHSEHWGWTRGKATIIGDSATFDEPWGGHEYGACRIGMKFLKPGTLILTDSYGVWDSCGFGYGVSGEGRYEKVSGKYPEWDHPEYMPVEYRRKRRSN